MKMLMRVELPAGPFNVAVREGTVGKTLNRILQETRPESAYFTEWSGKRGGILVFNVEDSSQIPSLAEPWFLDFDASVEFHVAMSPEDLGQAGLEELGRKWG